jgi:hypothetical protein
MIRAMWSKLELIDLIEKPDELLELFDPEQVAELIVGRELLGSSGAIGDAEPASQRFAQDFGKPDHPVARGCVRPLELAGA